MKKQTWAAASLVCALAIAGCKEAGWAKDEELSHEKPPAGQLPPLPTSYFPPPPTSSSEPPPPPIPSIPVQQPTAVTVTQTVEAPPPPPAPAPPNQPPVITIPLPEQLFN